MAEPEIHPSRDASSGTAPDPVLRLREGAVDWREVEGQIVALDRAASVYLAINQSGTELWPAIVEGATRSALVDILVGAFNVDATRAQADVDTFVADLRQRDLLER